MWRRPTGGWRKRNARCFGKIGPRSSPSTRVILLGNEIVGAYRVKYSEAALYLSSIEVHPRHQGVGIGTQIMSALEIEAQQGHLVMKLDVMKVNERALAFYKRLDFVIIGETKTHHRMSKTARPI